MRLSAAELLLAAVCGVSRRIISIRRGLDKNKHAEVSDWNTDIEGACYEAVVAKSLDVYWEAGVNTFKLPDVGPLHVRGTEYTDGHLIIRRNDGFGVYVFVTGALGTYEVRGCFKYDEKINDDLWREDAWWIPQASLEPLITLRKRHDQE